MENIKLDNGKILNRLYGKYQPNLTIISNKEIEDGLYELRNLNSKKEGVEYKDVFYKGFKQRYGNSMVLYTESEIELAKILGINNFDPENFSLYASDDLIIMSNSKVGGDIREKFEVAGLRIISEKSYYAINNKKIYDLDEFIKTFNIPYDGHVSYILEGEYRKNKKGTEIFDVTNKKNHYMIVIDWGGGFNRTRGVEIDKVSNYLYYKHARSNGGGNGYDYLIIPKDFKNQVSEDDF